MRGVLVALALSALGACTPRTAPITSDHPASPEAPIGRLAGSPPALRPGVVSLTEPTAPEAEPTGHEGHDMSPVDSKPTDPEVSGPTAEPTKSQTPDNPAPKTMPKTTAPKTTAPKPTAPKPTAPKPTVPKKSPEPKPDPKPTPKPVPDPHQGHDMDHH